MHIQILRTAVNRVRSYYNLSPVTWREEIIAGKTTIKNWPFHITEIRKSMDTIILVINDFDSATSFDIPPFSWLPIGMGRPKADVMEQVHNLIVML